MNIVVLVKQVPDTYSERKLRDDGVLDREATDAVLDEINERAVEAALQLKEANDGSEVTVLTMGPDRATDAIRKALSMGADKAVHLSDEALAGSDAVATAKVLAKAIGTVGAHGQHGDLGAVVCLLELQRRLDRALVDLIQHRVGGVAVQDPVVAQLAFGIGVGHLLDQHDDVHRTSSTSCRCRGARLVRRLCHRRRPEARQGAIVTNG